MRRCLSLVLAVGLAFTAVGCAPSDDAPSTPGAAPSPSPMATTTDDASETIALIGEDMWRFRQTVAAVFAAHPEVLETDAEKLEVSLAPDTSIEDAVALIAAVRAEVAADAAECVDNAQASCDAAWDLSWTVQGTEISLKLSPVVAPPYPADEVRALDAAATVVGTASYASVRAGYQSSDVHYFKVFVQRKADGGVPSSLSEQVPAASGDAQDGQIMYSEHFNRGDGVAVRIWYEDGAVLDRDSLARVLAQVRGADWREVSVGLSSSQAPSFYFYQPYDVEGGLAAEASAPVLSVLDDCTVTSEVVLFPGNDDAGSAAYTCAEGLEVDTTRPGPDSHRTYDPQLAATLLEAARQH